MCSLDRLVRLSLATLSPFHTVNTRSFQAFLAPFRPPPFVPAYRHVINDYMIFETNYATLMGTVYIAYYLLLEPVAAVSFVYYAHTTVITHLNLKLLYAPQMIIIILTATAFGQDPSHTPAIIAIHVLCWIAQFVGHGLAEKRAPALLDNLLGGKTIPDNLSQVVDVLSFALLAVVLAPFFVHLEILFGLGYRPAMHKRINNAIGKEITRIRKEEGDRRRKAQ